MKKTISRLALGLSFLAPLAGRAGTQWQQVNADNAPKNVQLMHPNHYLVYTLDEAMLQLQMANLPQDPAGGMIVSLPLPDGTFMDFNVWQTPMMPQSLAAQYPDIKTFTAEAVGNRSITAKLDFTMYGFHAMIFNGGQTSFIDPWDNLHDGFYMVHYKSDETRALTARMRCAVRTKDENGPAGASMEIQQKQLPKLDHKVAQKIANGYNLRTYRLALACDHQYAQAATGLSSPTVAQALAKMTTSMNRINGVYEREFSITMNLVANENSLIFVSSTGDPYGADDSNPDNLLTDNQTQCDALIGTANYDIGHVFSTGGGGLSLMGCVCQAGIKAQSCTGSPTPVGDGFDIDYVAHEMGHEYGSDHTFNDDNYGSCLGNIANDFAYEPGSGSTIMAYAGICDPDDLAYHSDPYFHSSSLEQIYGYISADGDVCAAHTATSNKLVKYASFTASYSIPYQTPFELTAPIATDSVADSVILYCWEERDLSTAGMMFSATHATGPIFRSFNPATTPTRIFPKLSMVLAGTLSDAGTEGAQGEKVPDVARTMVFKCSYRDIIHNLGCFTFPDDAITLNAINTTAGFKVTSQGTTGLSFNGATSQTVTWNVVSTNAAPISASTVDIYMSTNGGTTWQYLVGNFPNTGTATITVPNPAVTSSTCRFKVKGHGNVFFNINSANFTVTHNSGSATTPSCVAPVAASGAEINIFPVPARNTLYITASTAQHVVIYSAAGQTVWEGAVDSKTEIPVADWARGLYFARFADAKTGAPASRTFVVQ